MAAAILPDLPARGGRGSGAPRRTPAGVETVLLAAPTTPDERLERICARSRGFVYGVGLLGITGERDALAASAAVIAGRLKAVTDLPVLVGVGISTPAQAVEVCEVADGVVVGSAVVRRVARGGLAGGRGGPRRAPSGTPSTPVEALGRFARSARIPEISRDWLSSPAGA